MDSIFTIAEDIKKSMTLVKWKFIFGSVHIHVKTCYPGVVQELGGDIIYF